MCNHTISLETSPTVKGPKQYRRWERNLAAVWGHMVTGGGHSHLEETMSVFKKSFINTERDIGDWWKQMLEKSMIEAGEEEKRMAEERGSFHDGIPSVTVIVDGGWSKCSHKHSYNANSGVGIIVGKETGKLLHIGVWNRFAQPAHRISPKKSMHALKIGKLLRQKWKRTSLWRVSSMQRRYMVFDTPNSLVMGIVRCIQH